MNLHLLCLTILELVLCAWTIGKQHVYWFNVTMLVICQLHEFSVMLWDGYRKL